ncbi:MAG: tubulin-like doman-containing protein [bacterium]
MKALLIGCGQGGSRLTEAIMKIQCATFGLDETNHSIKKQFDALIINTNVADIKDIDKRFVHEKHRLIIGGGYSHTSGRGAGGDPRLGTQAARHDIYQIEAAIEETVKDINLNPEMTNIDAIIILSALGGGSGSGMGPVIAHLLKEKFGTHYPIIGIVSLPGEEEGQLNSYNASISINSWLKENNFEGIITIALGGKTLKPTDDSLEYFARYNKSFAKALYILFGGGTMGEGSKTVDVQDILTTIRDGGGICTLGHLSCHISEPQSTEVQDCPLLTVDSSTDKVAGSEVRTLLEKVEELCESHLFLPVNIKTARAGLMVIKDSTKFKLTKDAGSKAANCVQAKIDGPLRYSGLSHKKFPLITDNSNGAIFKDYEISDEDPLFTRNETVELALLVSGISDVKMIQDLEKVANKVFRFTRPPMGERLLAETLGLGIGEKIDSMRLLPCSNLRDNLEAQSQSKATNAVLEIFIAELEAINRGLLSDEKIKKGIRVVDVKPVPDNLVNCEEFSAQKIIHNCFEIELLFNNLADETHFRKKTVIRIQAYEDKESQTGKKTITWQPPEVLKDSRGWTEKEQEIADKVMGIVRKQFSDAVLCGIGDYPHIDGMVKKYVKRIRIITPPSKSEKVVCSYYYWIDAHPDPVIFSMVVLDAIQKSSEKKGYSDFWNILLEKTDEFPSTEKIHGIFATLNVNPPGGVGDE